MFIDEKTDRAIIESGDHYTMFNSPERFQHLRGTWKPSTECERNMLATWLAQRGPDGGPYPADLFHDMRKIFRLQTKSPQKCNAGFVWLVWGTSSFVSHRDDTKDLTVITQHVHREGEGANLHTYHIDPSGNITPYRLRMPDDYGEDDD